MKKTFSFIAPNKKPERQMDAIKYEIKKYLGRESRKKIPEGSDYWGFDCRIGKDLESAKDIHVKEINPQITAIFEGKAESFYLEILSKPMKRTKRS